MSKLPLPRKRKVDSSPQRENERDEQENKRLRVDGGAKSAPARDATAWEPLKSGAGNRVKPASVKPASASAFNQRAPKTFNFGENKTNDKVNSAVDSKAKSSSVKKNTTVFAAKVNVPPKQTVPAKKPNAKPASKTASTAVHKPTQKPAAWMKPVQHKSLAEIIKEKNEMIEQLQSAVADLQTHAALCFSTEQAAQEEIREKTERIKHLQAKGVKLQAHAEYYNNKDLATQKRISHLIKKADEKDEKHSEELHKLQTTHEILEKKYEAVCKEKSRLNSHIEKEKAERKRFHDKMQETEERLFETTSQQEQTQKNLTLMTNRCDEMRKELLEMDEERKRMHNTIQELKGNIRVFCRVRPDMTMQNLESKRPINYPDERNHRVVEIQKLTNVPPFEVQEVPGKKLTFTFDHVFQHEQFQPEIYAQVSQLVQSCLDGYNVCIFAYGQTGSGKTYTMEGGDGKDNEGVIPRAVRDVLATAKNLEGRGWAFKFHVSHLEIYNEELRDLLVSEGERVDKLEIKMVAADSKQVIVTNQRIVRISKFEEVARLLRRAKRNRAVAETKCNSRSSRSHSVFQLSMKCTDTLNNKSYTSLLNMVDLAGSENIKLSESEGERLTEAQKINKSLLELSNVIHALSRKDKHIPYRNSVLTYMLKDSLGGNSKVLMFVNISPTIEAYGESVNSLRFASKVNSTMIGSAAKVLKDQPKGSSKA